MSTEIRSYPRHVKTDAGDIEFRLMSAADEPAVLDFAQKFPKFLVKLPIAGNSRGDGRDRHWVASQAVWVDQN